MNTDIDNLTHEEANLNMAALTQATSVAIPGTHHGEIVQAAQAFRAFLLTTSNTQKEQA